MLLYMFCIKIQFIRSSVIYVCCNAITNISVRYYGWSQAIAMKNILNSKSYSY